MLYEEWCKRKRKHGLEDQRANAVVMNMTSQRRMNVHKTGENSKRAREKV